MKDFNKDKFNSAIERKLAGAEVQPGSSVWEGIEAELLKQDNRRMQKKASFYRNLAAAVIFIALISIYFNLQDFAYRNNQESTFLPEKINILEDRLLLDRNKSISSIPAVNSRNKQNDSEQIGEKTIGNRLSNEKSGNGNVLIASNEIERSNLLSTDENALPILEKLEIRNPASLSELPKLDYKIEKVSYFAVSNVDKVKERSTVRWNSNVNVGSGNFNPNSEITETPIFSTVSTLNNAGTNARTLTDQSSATSQERNAVEDLSSAPMKGNMSFTFGLNLGVQLNDRWNIKSGVQYGAFRSTSSSSTVLRDKNSDKLYPYHGASSSTEISDGRVVNAISEYELYNDFQIITFPLMLSYKIIDSKFDVSLVGGISADLILRNTLKGGSQQINEIEFNQNDRQSYKKVFASSIAGLDISYPFADKYAISIMPTFKKALSNITTENATFDSTPAFLGLNMSLTYMF
ncbi:hypothetical protein [Marivirga sp.]|uniref:hypothetical protein n=1 Tax=Marivirga sp. TaxID=2018662 RepID=UPI002D8002E6|nr:hypothetical protein [Marivirga sp.]HET8858616.1 hypothetical protein [Marivirga sp.]